jgi:class 3 adenylate cyclase
LKKAAAPQLSASGPSFEGERKAVTIMFADISGFTAMSEKMDPEQVRSMMNACFETLVPAIKDYDGTVNKFIGDEIMALFGAPAAHENDPERALRAALDMMRKLEEFNARNHTDLGLHFGINTGTVIAGSIGSSAQQQYDVMGDAVNLAARLEDASDRGQIFVGPDTYKQTAPLFDFEALEPIRLKGKAEPVAIYQLKAVKAMPGSVRGLAGLTSQMVGRDTELNALLNLTAHIQAGPSRVAVIIGEPGLGKSRLMAEWKTRSQADARWYEGRCVSYGQGLAYHLLLDLLHALIGVPAAAAEAETQAGLRAFTEDLFGTGEAWLEVYPYLGHLLSLELEGAALERVKLLDPQALQAQYLASLRKLLRALAERQPTGIVFDDIHWADPSSTELLIKLLPLTQEAPLLFCFVTRPDSDAPGWRLVTTARESLGEKLVEYTLNPLNEDDSRQLVSNLLEVEALPENIRTLILQKAEGNPFFVEEVIRMLIDRGAILPREEGRGWVAGKEIANVEIPDNLQGLLLARIDRLPEDVKRTLRVASVIGRQFAVKVLEQVLVR